MGVDHGDDDAALWGRLWRFDALVQLGELGRAEAELDPIEAIAARLRSPLARWHATRYRATIALARGRFAEALAAGRRGRGDRAAGRACGAPAYRRSACWSSPACSPARTIPTTDEYYRAHRDLYEGLVDSPAPAAFRGGLALEAMLGERDEAERIYRTLPPIGALPPFMLLPGIAAAGRTGRPSSTTGRPPPRSYQLLAPYAELVCAAAPASSLLAGSAARARSGVAAATLGRLDDAVRHLRAAIAANDRIGLPRRHPGPLPPGPGAGPTAAAGRPRRGGCARHLRRGHCRAARHAPLHRRARALADSLAGHRPARSPSASGEIAELVAQGLTNRQIAATAHISERTAETHVQHILTSSGSPTAPRSPAWVAADESTMRFVRVRFVRVRFVRVRFVRVRLVRAASHAGRHDVRVIRSSADARTAAWPSVPACRRHARRLFDGTAAPSCTDYASSSRRSAPPGSRPGYRRPPAPWSTHRSSTRSCPGSSTATSTSRSTPRPTRSPPSTRRDDAAAFAAMTAAARSAVRGGVTTVRDLGDRGYLSIGLRDAAAGDPTLPTIVAAGPPITTPGGHCHFLGGAAEGVEGVRAAVREHAEHGVDVIKIMASGGNLTPGSRPEQAQFGPAELRAAVDEAHRLGLPIVAHAHGTQAIADALAAGVDGLEHVTFMTADGVDADPGRGAQPRWPPAVTVGMTLGLHRSRRDPAARHGRPDAGHARQRPQDAEAGVTMIPGTDAGLGPGKPHDVMRWAIAQLPADRHERRPRRCTPAPPGRERLGLGQRKGRLRPGTTPTSSPSTATR